MSVVNTSAATSSDGLPLTQVYDQGSGTEIPLAAGTVLTDANHNSQKSAPALVQGGKAANTPPSVGDAALVAAISPNNTGLPVNIPGIVQKAAAVSTGSVASLAAAFTNNNAKGNTIVVVAGCGNGTAMTVADSAGNTYVQAVTAPNSTTFEAAIFYSSGCLAGANTVTVTNAGTAASMAVEVYEVSGLLAVAAAQPDYTSLSTGTSAAPSAPNHAPSLPNSIAFMGVAVGTAAQAVSATASSGWTLDSTQNTATPAGLYSFGALNAFLASTAPITPKATLAGSEPYAIAAAVFKPVALPIMGVITQDGYNYTHITGTATTLVKSGSGILHAIIINKTTNSGVVEFDDALTQTNAMGIITMPATVLQNAIYLEYDIRFNTGLSVTTSGASQDITFVWK